MIHSQLPKWQITVRQYFMPLADGSGPMRSMPNVCIGLGE